MTAQSDDHTQVSRDPNPAPQAGCAKEGWQLVPKEPTPEMFEAGLGYQAPDNIYRAMLSASPPPPIAESGWQEMKTAKRDKTTILLRFAPSSGFVGCMLCWFDKDNPKGNPWRVPLCNAWFGEDLFDAWMPAPPHIAEQKTGEKP